MRTTRLTALCLTLLVLPLAACDRGSDAGGRGRQGIKSRPRSALAVSARARSEWPQAHRVRAADSKLGRLQALHCAGGRGIHRQRCQRALRGDRPVGRHERGSREAHRLRAEAQGRSRDVLGRQRLGRARKPHPRGGRERAAGNSARRFPLLPRGWRPGNAAARGLQRRRAADLRGRIARVPALHQRRTVHDRGGRQRARGDRKREFPGVSRHAERQLLPADRRLSLYRGKTRGALGHDCRPAAGLRRKFRRAANSHRSQPSSRRRRRRARRRP